ncbi:MAG: V-type ATP synthase subunit A [Thermoprotei archaeon]|nr:V-type ATP synthase subunit A [TACK group archaeon]
MVIQMRIYRVSGAVVEAEESTGVKMHELVLVGGQGLVGEVIRIDGDRAFVQVYEDTYGLKPGEPITCTGNPLSVELGPGLIGTIYDGIQRPLSSLKEKEGAFIKRGVSAPPLDRTKRWHFLPIALAGQKVAGGQVLGYVQETEIIKHAVLVPPDVSGELQWVADEGDYSLEDPIARLPSQELHLYHRWPVRTPRPYMERLPADEPLVTGQRIIDALFPVAKGGSAIIPGGFGTGKTVVQHQLAKWADADVVVYVGCGERGNEMTEVLRDFPKLMDPRTGKPLMMRTVLIANTSNMPVAAREASIYTGITIAEYFRDMGYNVALMADSTSRWAEALREISGRLEEMPGEEGYPPYLASRLAEFYERAGRVKTLQGKEGSVTVVGAVSPMGGDFSEPVTQNSLRFVQVFWGLDKDLADRRHFPSINWITSYSQYSSTVSPWWIKHTGEDWPDLVAEAFRILQTENDLESLVRLVGIEALPESQKLTLLVARVLREGFLQQNAFNDVDTYSSPRKQYLLLKAMIGFYRSSEKIIEKKIPEAEIEALPIVQELIRARFTVSEESKLEDLAKRAEDAPKSLAGEIDRGDRK